MPGLGMNGHSDYGRFGQDRGHINGHLDPYSRDDPYRDMKADEDLYRRPMRDGGSGGGPRPANDRFSSDLADQSSLSDFNSSEPAFELDHLATFAAGGIRKGMMHVEDGLRKLRQMENTTGIWTMRCILLVERRFLVILDKNSGDELERFPISYIQEPTAIFKNDRREIYNNLVLFTVMDEANKRDAQADMHIFQSIRTPAQSIVDEIFASKRGQARVSNSGYKIPPPPTGPAPEPQGPRGDPYDFGGFQESLEQRQYNQFSSSSQYGASQFNNGGGFLGGAQRTSIMARPSYSPYREREDEVGSNELLERDVQLLNHCFDDVEKFVARLQQAAEAYKELEKRRKERGGKGKKNASGDGMLGHRARPPPAQDFVDIFQKFKLSFNLLAKLKAHIHDPNAPELVHFLFTPLSLIYEASRDPIHGSINLGEQATAPVLTQDAKQLLLNCLTSKEIEVWQALGKNWTTSKDEWKGYIPPYVPRFYDGWQPAPTVVEEPVSRANLEPVSRANLESAVAAHHNQILNRQHEQDVRDYVRDRVMPFPPEEERFSRERAPDFQRFEPDLRASTPPREAMSNPSVVGYQQYVEQHIDRNYRANQPRAPEPVSQAPPPVSRSPAQQAPLDDNAAYLEELKKTGTKVYEVLHERQGKNAKELTVNKGDYLQVLDNSRNWWKVRNYKGQTGYCPYTILKEVTDDSKDGVGTTVEPTTAPPLPSDRQGSSSKRDFASDQFEMRFVQNSMISPRSEEAQDATISTGHFEDMDVPPISAEEEDMERHAFRPVEPPTYYNHRAFMPQTQPQIDLQNELRSRMGQGPLHPRPEDRRPAPEARQQSPATQATASPTGSAGGMRAFYITNSSSQADVSSWLQSKGFSTVCRRTLQGFTGRDLFSLHRHEMEQLIGHEEAARLEGQLTLQKKMTGYKTQSAAELNAIFQKRRARSDQQGAPLGQPPDFRPLTPSSYDGPDSDSDTEDKHLGETGKTLRDLLIRQRQKIVGSSVFNQQ